MYIGIAALAFASFLSFGAFHLTTTFSYAMKSTNFAVVIRAILIRENKQLAVQEADALNDPDHRQRIEDAARLEGLTFEEAVERKKGFRYLY